MGIRKIHSVNLCKIQKYVFWRRIAAASVRTGCAMTDLITAKAEPMGSAFAEKREKNEESVLFMKKPCG